MRCLCKAGYVWKVPGTMFSRHDSQCARTAHVQWWALRPSGRACERVARLDHVFSGPLSIDSVLAQNAVNDYWWAVWFQILCWPDDPWLSDNKRHWDDSPTPLQSRLGTTGYSLLPKVQSFLKRLHPKGGHKGVYVWPIRSFCSRPLSRPKHSKVLLWTLLRHYSNISNKPIFSKLLPMLFFFVFKPCRSFYLPALCLFVKQMK